MKKILCLLCMLIITGVFISGCGKMSTKEMYKYSIDVDMGTSYKDVVDDFGGKGEIIDNQTSTKAYRWKVDQNSNSETVNMRFNKEDDEFVLTRVVVPFEVAFYIAKENNNFITKHDLDAIQKKIEPEKAYRYTYAQIKDMLNCDGIISARGNDFTAYVWFTQEGNGMSAVFYHETEEEDEYLGNAGYIRKR